MPLAGRRSAASPRLRYAIVAAVTIAVGMAVHLHARALPHSVRDMLGDALWASMIYWLLGAVAPHARRRWRVTAALAVCAAVELSQLWHPAWLDSIRHTLPGHLVLGSDFDPRDLLAYGLGVLAAALLDRARLFRE